MARCGKRMCFHGAFTSKAKAKRKEKRVGGFIRAKIIKGHRRYLVLTRKGK